MRTLEAIAVDMLRTALASAPTEKMFDSITATEVARIAVHHITTCPRCGAEAWCDIDCFVCELAGKLLDGEEPPMTLPEWIRMV